MKLVNERYPCYCAQKKRHPRPPGITGGWDNLQLELLRPPVLLTERACPEPEGSRATARG